MTNIQRAFLSGFIKAAGAAAILGSVHASTMAAPHPTIQPDKFSDSKAWVDTAHTDRPIPNTTIEAIKQRETRNIPGTTTIGDHGDSIGPLQEQRDFYEQATNRNPALSFNKSLGQPYGYQDVTNYPYASAVMRSGLNQEFDKSKLLKHTPWTTYNLARVFNGGQGGPTNPDTIPYANKVVSNKNYLLNHPGYHFPGVTPPK